MSSINKKLKNENLDIVYICDKTSKRGQPTNESLVLTIVLNKDNDDVYTIGIALKVPGDNFVPRIGKAIAYRNWKTRMYQVDNFSKLTLLSTAIKYFNTKLKSHIRERLYTMFMIQFYYNYKIMSES